MEKLTLNSKRRLQGPSTAEWLIIVAILGTIAVLNWELPRSERIIDFRPQCKNHLKQLGLALYAFHDAHGHFPPPYVADKDGQPMHSWRVLLLPYLREQGLYEQYNFNEPWNGPHNSKLADQMPAIFGCPDQNVMRTESRRWVGTNSNYLAAVGPHAAFVPVESRRLSDFKGEVSTKIMLVEITGSDIHWMEPRDMDVSKPPLAITGKTHQKRTGLWSEEDGNHILKVDGSVGLLPADTKPETLSKMIKVD